MKNKFIVALAAKKRCGKDTVAGYLREDHGFKSIALAGPIKEVLYAGVMDGFCKKNLTWEDINGETKFDRDSEVVFTHEQFVRISMLALNSFEEYHNFRNPVEIMHLIDDTMVSHEIGKNPGDFTVRRLMQFIGTDLMCNRIDKMIWVHECWAAIKSSNHENWVITDCRQQHELSWMRQSGVKVIGITRPGLSDDTSDTHSTERGLRLIPNLDPVIINNGSLEELRTKTANCIRHIIKEESPHDYV